MIKLIIRRLLFLILVIWAASTITFFIPRLSDKNPVRERFAELAKQYSNCATMARNSSGGYPRRQVV